MLYQLLYSLHTQFSFFNVFRYITLRTIYATLTALVITFLLGPVRDPPADPIIRSASISEKTDPSPISAKRGPPPWAAS